MLAAAPILTGTLTGDGTSTTLTQALSPTLSVPEQAGGLLDARAITLQVANNSGQSMTALTVLLQDTVGGLPVSASYPVSMTANLATGAAGQYLVTLWGSGIGSVVAVQATFASAPASAATVSLRAIVQTAGAAGVSLVGSLAPLDPVQMTTQYIAASDLSTASNTYYFFYPLLHRNARAREVTIGHYPGGQTATSLNAAVSVSAGVIDSNAGVDISGVFAVYVPQRSSLLTTAVSSVGSDNVAFFTSAAQPAQIGAMGDTLVVAVSTGSTEPTSGNLPIYVWELL